MKKKLYISTYGCQMNFYDSQRMEDYLTPLGFELCDSHEDADMVILNTCHIREKAAEKVYSELGRIRLDKEKKRAGGGNMLIAVAGCVSQAEGDEIFRRAPYVDMVVGSQSYHRLPDMVANAQRASRQIDLDFSVEPKFDNLPEANNASGSSAFLTVQEGCDKFCTFCVVPYTRGAEFSRPVPDIYREALRLVQSGAKEIVLLGQNVNAYHGSGLDGDVWSLGRLIKHLSKIRGIERIRYTTSHPRDMDAELIEVHGTVEELMPYLHLPVQSGSDRILKLMNRKHTSETYLRIIESLRKSRPDMVFASDFIVGFPGETDKDFQDTLKLVRDVGYSQAYSFKYSPRPGTPAATKEDQVPEQVKTDRLAELQALINDLQLQYNRSTVGRTLPVLFEKQGKREGQLVGRSPYMQSVHVMNAESYMDKIVDVKIENAFANSISGSILKEDDRQAAADEDDGRIAQSLRRI